MEKRVINIKTFRLLAEPERRDMTSQDKYSEMMTKLQEAKELYLKGACTLDELVIQCALLGVTQVKTQFEQIEEKRLS
jgi:hypothetical protein